MCVCVCVCVCVYVCVCMCMCVYVCVRVCVCLMRACEWGGRWAHLVVPSPSVWGLVSGVWCVWCLVSGVGGLVSGVWLRMRCGGSGYENHFAEIQSGYDEGSYLRLTDLRITQR